jgi:hypothetical protein
VYIVTPLHPEGVPTSASVQVGAAGAAFSTRMLQQSFDALDTYKLPRRLADQRDWHVKVALWHIFYAK